MVVTFVAIVFLGKLSSDVFTAVIPLKLNIRIQRFYSDTRYEL